MKNFSANNYFLPKIRGFPLTQTGSKLVKKTENLQVLRGSSRVPYVFAAVCGVGGFFVANQLVGIETSVFNQVLPALADFGLELEGLVDFSQAPVAFKIIECVLFAVIVFAGFKNGKDNNRPELYIAAAGTYIVSWVIQIILAVAYKATGAPLSCLLELVLGIAYGQYSKHQAAKDKLLETKSIEAKMRNIEIEEIQLELVRANEMERRLLATDLHDQVLNDLKKIVDNFKAYEENPNKNDANKIRAAFSKTMNDIREIMDDLSPVILQNFGLRAAIEDCLEKAKERSGFEIDFVCTFEDDWLDQFPETDQVLLYRLVQESLTNISKHAGATTVSIRMENKDQALKIVIDDNGKGLDYDKASQFSVSRGVRYMRLRAKWLDGNVFWSDRPEGKGTRVTIDCPVRGR